MSAEGANCQLERFDLRNGHFSLAVGFQGSIGDCYLIGALSMLSLDRPQLLNVFPTLPPSPSHNEPSQQQQKYNPGGVYALRFFRGSSFRVVVVDDLIPCGADGNPCFARPACFAALPADRAPPCFWLPLIEKVSKQANKQPIYTNIYMGRTFTILFFVWTDFILFFHFTS